MLDRLVIEPVEIVEAKRGGPLHAAMSADEASRVRLAARSNTPASVLRSLAEDPAVTVRAAVAINPVYAPAADRVLLADEDDRIRSLLAGKMARLLPGLPGNERSAAQAHVHSVLMTLANDAAVRVRQAIVVAIVAVPDVPRDLVLTLARDPVFSVSDPVVRFSPQLTDADLLDLLATPPHSGTAVSVASRAGLSAEVADDIASHADTAAVRALLANRSATIQEATLDALVGRAGEHPEWHEPLVCRPALPVRAMRALSSMVAGHLLDMLTSRADMPPPLARELRERVAENLAEPLPPSESAVLDGVRQLNASGALNEAALMEAVAAGEPRQAAAILAVAGGVTLSTIDRAVGLRSAKAIISIVARAGFSMRAAVAIQGLLGRLAPGDVLHPTAEGHYPLTQNEMEWQIELLAQPGR